MNLFDLIIVGTHFGETIGVSPAPERSSAPISATIRFENPRFSGNNLLLDLIIDTDVPLVGYHIRIAPEGFLKVNPDSSESGVFRLEGAAEAGTLVAAKLGVGISRGSVGCDLLH